MILSYAHGNSLEFIVVTPGSARNILCETYKEALEKDAQNE